jgi:cytochrome P450
MYKLTEPLTAWLMPWRASIKHHLAVIDDFAFGVIDKRRQELATGQKYGDLLSRFMAATNEKNEQLSNRELRDVVLNFVIAGRDTTAQALSWTFYCLLTDPRVEHALLEEVNLHITDDLENDPAALYEVIKGMKYANAV